MNTKHTMKGAKNAGWSADAYTKLVAFDGDWRDSWWNQDFLELMASRLEFERVASVLDVGSGAGHWGQRIATVLPAHARLSGVDHEAAFVEAARERAIARGLDHRCEYLVASGEGLPFPDDSFDLVTCQTLLMHVSDAKSVLREMLRVAAPGGVILAVEPNNMVNALVNNQGAPRIPFDDVLEILRFEDICQRGKVALGQGDSSVGGRLPALFAELGMTDVRSYTNDRTSMLLPPYDAADQRADVEQLMIWLKAEVSPFGTKDKAIDFFRAGGGSDDAAFETGWEAHRKYQTALRSSIESKTYTDAGGHMHYLGVGRKARA